MRRAFTTITTGLLFGLIAQGASAEVADVLAAPGPCAEPRVELRGSPVSALDAEDPALRTNPIGTSAKVGRAPGGSEPEESPIPPFDAEERELRDSPIPPLASPPGSGPTPGAPVVQRGEPAPEATPPFDVSGGPRDHFDPQDVAADLGVPTPPRPEPPAFSRRACDIPGVCSGPVRGPVAIVAEPKPTPLPGPQPF